MMKEGARHQERSDLGLDSKRERAEHILTQLRDYAEQGYLFHGGKTRVDVLEPRQAHDDDPDRRTGKARAVYATDDIRIPIVMALFEKADPALSGWQSSYTTAEDGTLLVSGENCTLTQGFIHVLPPETFESEGDEHDRETLSFAPVAPIDIIPVDADVLAFLDGISIDPVLMQNAPQSAER